jgi:hypothetical protein
MPLSTLLAILPLLIEGSKNGSDTASVGIKDSLKAAKRAVFLSSVETLLTDDELDKETVFELKKLSTAGSDWKVRRVNLFVELVGRGNLSKSQYQ